jgi:archaellum biogenesis protein FlaJ (TadC family)
MLSALVGLVVAAVVGMVVLTVVLAILGVVFGLAFGILGMMIALAIKVVPLVLVGWVVVKLIQRSERKASYASIPASDRRWLDS